jgi:hypothetical protein
MTLPGAWPLDDGVSVPEKKGETFLLDVPGVETPG